MEIKEHLDMRWFFFFDGFRQKLVKSWESEGVSASFRDRRCYVDPLLHTKGQGTFETVEFARQICHRFLEFIRCDLHCPPGKKKTVTEFYYVESIEPKKVLLHHYATPKLIELGYKLLPHSPYSPVLPYAASFCF